jgi:predicted phage terminase large subunit-like protein
METAITETKLPSQDPPTLDERRYRLIWAKTRLAEQSLHDFVSQAWHVIEPEEKFFDNWHIQAICFHLEAVTEGKIPQLLINVPPGTMKSLLCCVFWPAWVWTTKPGKRFMFSSYSESLALRDSMRTRDLVANEWYQKRWPVQLKEDQNTKGRFDNSASGWRIVGSISGKGIGEHPHFNIVDDPHNVLQAESDAERQSVTRWFEGVFCVRGEILDAKRVLIMQRLHSQDCSGVALSKGGWQHLCLPMKFDPEHKTATLKLRPTSLGFFDPRTKRGELLWPDKYTAFKVANMEVNLGLYGAAGQLQQEPSPRGGGKFKRNWFEILEACPTLTNIVRYWDKAGTKGGTGAETSGALMGTYIDAGTSLPSMRQKFIVLDVISLREEAAEREAIIRQTAQADKMKWGYVTTWVEQEPGSGGKESAQSTVGNLIGFTCNVERVTGSKEVRADPMATQASVGKVKFLLGRWNSQALDELEAFPNGRLKDIVDALSGAFNKFFEPSEAFASTEGIRVGQGSAHLITPDILSADDLDLRID